MDFDIYKKIIELFDIQFENDTNGEGLFKHLGDVVSFDAGFVFIASSDCINLKYSHFKDSQTSVANSIQINSGMKDFIYNKKSYILPENNEISSLIGLGEFSSFIILKLFMRETVFGFLLLCKKEKDFYSESIISPMEAISAVISYKVKDDELSDVFKLQLNALKNGILQTKQAFKTIKEQNAKILEADKVKNDFLANISHELRTPLNAIIGFSDILSNKLIGELNEKQSEYVKDIHVSGIHLLGMINELLDISKLEAKAMKINKSSFCISLALNEVINIVKPLASKKNIKILCEFEDKEIYVDFQKIMQILYNLLSNAIKFSHENSKIFVTVEFDLKSVTLKIKDEGVGIPKKDQLRIFEKFVQLESAYTKKESSTGLGLTITKELVEMHDGTISLESEPQKGSTFIVKLPCLK